MNIANLFTGMVLRLAFAILYNFHGISLDLLWEHSKSLQVCLAASAGHMLLLAKPKIANP